VHHVVEFGFERLLVEGVGVREIVQQVGHPPREALGLPDAAQARAE
jgi:hypothetical protein